MRIYTRGGDAGETALLGGKRVQKNHQRMEACGTIDELNATIGLIRAENLPVDLDRTLERRQHELFALGAELAAETPDRHGAALLTENHVRQLESQIDAWEAELPALTAFILPAGPRATVALHLARCVCRRAERAIVSVAQQSEIRPTALQYVNRLSDYLFVAARYSNLVLGGGETAWNQGI